MPAYPHTESDDRNHINSKLLGLIRAKTQRQLKETNVKHASGRTGNGKEKEQTTRIELGERDTKENCGTHVFQQCG